MTDEALDSILKALQAGESLSQDVWVALLTTLTPAQQFNVRNQAHNVSLNRFGTAVYVRGLIEISSYCRNNCRYCGLRASNIHAERYRLSREEILSCCRTGYAAGFRTFVLQGGEDSRQTDQWLADLVVAIKEECPDAAVTLSVGERAPHSRAAFEQFRRAGADRYLLRHETRSDEHYRHLHPDEMDGAHRCQCLFHLRELGFQIGAGMMIGSPGQTPEYLAQDLDYLCTLRPEMIGIGPFIPAAHTPFSAHPAGSLARTLFIVALLRLRFPDALIPATTALSTLAADGYEQGILSGANVLMLNLSPLSVRRKYTIYDHKACMGIDAAESFHELAVRLQRIGHTLCMERGDYVELLQPKICTT